MADLLIITAQTLNPGLLNGGRLTLTTLVPVTTADVIGASVVYFTPGAPPFYGDRIALQLAGNWQDYAFAEKAVTLAGLTPAALYDWFAYDKAGNVAVDLGPAWTNITTRAQAVSLFNGVPCNTSQFTSLIGGDLVPGGGGRLLGTGVATGATTMEDSQLKRYLGNVDNRVPRTMNSGFVSDSHQYATQAYREWHAGASSIRLQWVNAWGPHAVQMYYQMGITVPVAAGAGAGALAIDNTTNSPGGPAFHSPPFANTFSRLGSSGSQVVGVGFHYQCALEFGDPSSPTFADYQHGLTLLA